MDHKRENIEAHAKAADELKYIIREIEVLKNLDHPAIMKLFEYYLSASLHIPLATLRLPFRIAFRLNDFHASAGPNSVRIYLVLELLPGGELLTALQKRCASAAASFPRATNPPFLRPPC